MDTGKIIKNARIGKSMTQTELGEKLGVKKSAVSKWERGETQNIKRSILKKLSDILEIPPAALIGNISNEDNSDEYPMSTMGLVLEETILLEYLSCMTQENKDKLINYAYKLLEEQNQQMLQAMARMNRLKKDDDEQGL